MRRKAIKGEYSIVTKDVTLEEGVTIWNFCNLYGCHIGANTQVGSYSEIKAGAKVGSDCRFQSYVFIPEDTLIGNKVFLGPNVVFLNDKHPTVEKTINDKWSLDAVVVEDEVSIGGGAVILPGVRIKKGAAIGAGAVVTKDVEEYNVVIGNPARSIGDIRDERFRKYQVNDERSI